MSGFICMHREALEHPLLKDPARLGAWFWLVARAAWKPTPFDVNGKIITLERGQLCVSFRQLSDEWGWSKSTVERFFTRLKTETMIGTDSGTGRLIVTICNYAKYQDKDQDSGTPSGTPSGTRAGHERDTKEQGNKGTIYNIDKSMFVNAGESEGETGDGKPEPTPDEKPKPAKPKVDPAIVDEAIECYRLAAQRCGWKIPIKIDSSRRAKLVSRLDEHGLEGWKNALRRAVGSETLGHDPPTWFSFDWITKNSGNILKVLEGNYDKRFGNNGGNQPKIGATRTAINQVEQRIAAQASRQDGLFRIADNNLGSLGFIEG